ncbi:MAG: glycosyltransferase family 9 protein [Verrucomicrobiales bacterium]|nr:glycosyltransferase family 9 protein [Verrucomicrobiales bacterium]
MRILIVKLSAIGDVIHTLPALMRLRRHFPEAEIHWLVEEPSATLLLDHPGLDRVWVVPRRKRGSNGTESSWGASMRKWWRFAREFRREKYDCAFDFQGLAKSAIWVLLARSRRKIGFGRGLPRSNEGAWLTLNERVAPPSADMHALDRGLYLLSSVGIERGPLDYGLPRFADDEAQATALLAQSGVLAGTRFVAVNPVTRWRTKDWEAARFAATCDRIVAAGLPVVFTGGAGDREAIDAIVALMKERSGRLEGRTSLRCLAEVYRRATLLLTTDTGPMHLAAALGTPVVALFGPTAPWRTGPYGDGHVVLRQDLSCSPCFKRTCGTRRYEERACMLRHDPHQVAEAVLRRIAAQAPLPAPRITDGGS